VNCINAARKARAVWLIEEDHVGGEHELRLLRAVVIRRRIVRAIIAEFRAEHDGRSDPAIPGNHMLAVFRFEPGTLPPDVVEVFVPDGNEVLRVDLVTDIP
jgi:hypothetical protein